MNLKHIFRRVDVLAHSVYETMPESLRFGWFVAKFIPNMCQPCPTGSPREYMSIETRETEKEQYFTMLEQDWSLQHNRKLGKESKVGC